MPEKIKLYALIGTYTQYYDDPDEGMQDVCDVPTVIAYAFNNPEILNDMQQHLTAGYENNCWSEARCKFLRSLYPQYNECVNEKFEVVDVTDMVKNQEAKDYAR